MTRDRIESWAKTLGTVLLWVGGAIVAMQVIGWLRAPSLPDRAPEFTLPDLDGKPVSLSDFQGQTVVVNFWATWCGPCRIEAPELSRFADANPDIPVLGVAADGPAEKLRATSRQLGISYPVLQGNPEVLGTYDISSFPTTVVVGPEGDVRTAHVGMVFRPHLAWMTR